MTSLSATMSIALSSLQTAQLGLNTVSHNLANVNTAGYSRQELVQESRYIGGYGYGSQVNSIDAVIDKYVRANLITETSNKGYADAAYTLMSNVETVFGAPSGGTSTDAVISNFFSELNKLSANPQSDAQKLNVIKAAQFAADSIKAINAQLQETQRAADNQIDQDIIVLNDALEQIHKLNEEIVVGTASGQNGQNTNDLEDQRQQLIEEIAERLEIRVTYDRYNRASVQTVDGKRLVDSNYSQLERVTGAGSFSEIGARPISSDGKPGTSVYTIDLNAMDGGSFKALADVRDTEIPNILAQLDEFADTMISEINALHSEGTSVPPQQTLTSGNGHKIPAAGADLFAASPAGLGITPGGSFEISVVDSTTGDAISTTVGGTSITLPGAGPFTLNDLATLINGNPDIGGDVTASVIADANGNPAIQITANQPPANAALVMRTNSGNTLGALGMNNFFTGIGSGDIAVRSDIASDPSLFATARMRTSDGGLSLLDNSNALELAQAIDRTYTYDAAGGMGAQTDSLTGYFISISSSLAVNISNKGERLEFAENLYNDVSSRNASVSGVNQDEELAAMLIYQNSYQASSRIISVVDELLETLINMV